MKNKYGFKQERAILHKNLCNKNLCCSVNNLK